MVESAPQSRSQRTSPLIIFIHLPKTGGTTMRSVLEQQYGGAQIFKVPPPSATGKQKIDDFSKLPPEERDTFKVVYGHFDYGAHIGLEETNFTYFTILRNPVDRVISHYYFVKQRTNHRLHKNVVSEDMSLQEYATSGLTKEVDNHQTRVLIGKEGVTPAFGACPSEFLERAKQHLQNEFAVVGTSERFDETLLVLQEVLGWSIPFYVSRNITKSRPKSDALPPDVVEAISKYNQLDLELHRYANERLDELIATRIQFFKVKLFLFRLFNNLYSRFYDLSRSFPEGLQAQLDANLFGEDHLL